MTGLEMRIMAALLGDAAGVTVIAGVAVLDMEPLGEVGETVGVLVPEQAARSIAAAPNAAGTLPRMESVMVFSFLPLR